MSKQINIRLPQPTINRLKDLVKSYGSQAKAVIAAIELLHTKEIEMAAKYDYVYIEGNAGGLHLLVLAGEKPVAGITNLEYATPGEWQIVKDGLSKNPLNEVRGWDGQMSEYGIDPAQVYDDLASYTVVCKNGVLYPSRMGRAAEIYFGLSQP